MGRVSNRCTPYAEVNHRADGGSGAGGKKTGVVRKMTKQVPDGIVAVVKGLMDDDNPEVKRRVAAVTRALQQPAKLVGPAAAFEGVSFGPVTERAQLGFATRFDRRSVGSRDLA